MFNFTYDYCDHVAYLNLLAATLGVPVTDNQLWLPATAGTGYIRVEVLANGLQVLINECTLHQDFFIHRNAGDGTGFTLRFDELRNVTALSVKMGDMVLEENTAVYSVAFLSNSAADLAYTINAKTEDRCVNIYFTADWFNKYFGLKANDEISSAVFSPASHAIHFDVLTIGYRELMEEIFELKKEHPVYPAALQNRIMLLLEKFFRRLYEKVANAGEQTSMPDEDLKRMVQIEAILVKDACAAPPPIPELARIAMMSETKLKTLFKKTYQFSLYEYYQKNRMLKAKQLISTRKYSVKEVGTRLGFKNLSNFTLAFKKQFNKLPSES